MSFGEEITQLLLIIVVLGVAYFGITAWVKRGGSLGGGGSAGGGAGSAGGADGSLIGNLGDDLGGRSGGSADRGEREFIGADGRRFDLKGKDAEAAAKVLKRMLKQDKTFKNQQK